MADEGDIFEGVLFLEEKWVTKAKIVVKRFWEGYEFLFTLSVAEAIRTGTTWVTKMDSKAAVGRVAFWALRKDKKSAVR